MATTSSTRVVILRGGSPWGLTLSGGKDFRASLQILKVTPGGKAMSGGIKEKEYILAINGEDSDNLAHHEAQQKIKTTGTTLSLKLSTEKPKGGSSVVVPSTPPSNNPSSSPSTSRPKPPPAPVQTPPASQSTISPKQQSQPSQVPATKRPVVKKSAVTNEPPAAPSKLVPDSGLSVGQESTLQSPAFKKITVESPSVMSPQSTQTQAQPQAQHQTQVRPPTEQMKNVVIDDRNTRKTSQRPLPPSNVPTQFNTTTMRLQSNTGPKAQPPIAKPAPPPTAKQQSKIISPSTDSNVQSGGASPMSPSNKITSRQGVCEACHQPIRGAYASAMNKVWHPEHFICLSCQKSLSNCTFIFEDDKIFCDQCYENQVAATCFKCKRPIVGQSVDAANNHYHRSCFTCAKCFVDLTTQGGFNMEANEIYCGDCFSDDFGAICNACGNKIGGNELWVEALDSTWHPRCFVCENCKIPLDGSRFFAKFGHPYCERCS